MTRLKFSKLVWGMGKTAGAITGMFTGKAGQDIGLYRDSISISGTFDTKYTTYP